MSKKRARSGRRPGAPAPTQAPAPTRPPSLRELIDRLSDYTAVQPSNRIRLETEPAEYTGRIMDLVTPLGRGQRCLITSPPKAGKTTILQTIARAVAKNCPDIHQLALLIDERPEEATDFKRNLPIKVVASTADKPASHHIKCAEKVFSEAITLMLEGKDVLVLLDSITRLARAYNQFADAGGKTLSGGVTAGALDIPRQLFGAARNLEEGGSLTIVATALVDTGSRMDEVIFQEFKGTGNMEVILDRELANRRIWPAIHVAQSGTRREEILLDELEAVKVPALRRHLADNSDAEALQWLLKRMRDTKTNWGLLRSV